MQRLVPLTPVLVFAVLLVGLGFSLTNDPHKMPSMLIDKAMPAFTLASLEEDGKAFSSSDLAGKVSLLNVFASWCPGCRVEHPMFMQLAEKGAVSIYGINWKDNLRNGERWLKANQSPYLRVGYDESGRVGIDLGVTGVPETFVIDRTGRVRYRHAGPLTEDVWREIFEPLLAQLQAEPRT
jgi:cytochrome c biogenesis protein CcmG, thiol:disulfide interchange protein DsbE